MFLAGEPLTGYVLPSTTKDSLPDCSASILALIKVDVGLDMSQFQEKNLTVKEAVEKNNYEFIRYKIIRNERGNVRRNNIYTNRR